jgi:hypothetical protein
MSPVLRRSVAFFAPTAVGLTVLALLVAVATQQDLRQGANDPQQQLAEDAATRLDAGEAPETVVRGPEVDLAASLSPFVAVYRTDGTIVASDGLLDGGLPDPPSGILATARSAGVDRVTWQPRSGVRIALVAVPWSGGTVVAGRSLRRVEEIVTSIQQVVALIWLAGVIAVAGASVIAARLWPDAGTTGESTPRR